VRPNRRGNDSDGMGMLLENAVQTFLENRWGAVIVCPPVPIAVDKGEDPSELVLLDDGLG